MTASGMPWRRRLVSLGCLAALGLALGSGLRFRGVSGDLVPLFEPRWSGGSAAPANRSLAVDGAGPAGLGDYPQFLGPHRDATLPDAVLDRHWSARPPREVWRRPIGEGWSAFAVAGGRAVTQEQDGDEELVVAYELATGRVLWRHADRARYDNPVAGVGPRATPTISDGRVFTLGARGRLNALDVGTGTLLWTHDLETELGSPTPEWGRPGSPLVVDGTVVVPVGGEPGHNLVAFDIATGEVAWRAGSDWPSYSSPTLLTLGGRRQIVHLGQGSVSGHAAGTGRVLWSFPWPAAQPNVAVPVSVDGARDGERLLVSSGYGVGAKLLRIVPVGDGFEPRLVWESPRLKAKFTNVVVHEGFVYGLDDGVLVCLDPETGERRWKSGRYGHGQVILAGDLLLVQSEHGEIALVEARPDTRRELGRFRAFDGKTWNPPALAGRYLVLRNHRQAALFELPVPPR
jgi:outer membrane protein assembly factor BamB